MPSWLLTLMFFAVAAVSAPLQAQGQTPTVMVGKWDQSAKLQNGILTYYWMTPKPNQRLMAQSRAGFDQHATSVTLAPPQQAWVRQWERRYQVFSLPRHYPKTHRAMTYGDAYNGGILSVKDGKRAVSSAWGGTNRSRRADVAVAAFLTWARQTTGA